MDAIAEREMRVTVWRLFFCQALMQATVVGQVAMSALIGHTLSADAALATQHRGPGRIDRTAERRDDSKARDDDTAFTHASLAR